MTNPTGHRAIPPGLMSPVGNDDPHDAPPAINYGRGFSSVIARNVNDAYRYGMQLMARSGVSQSSRVGQVYRVPGPVLTIYSRPTERVLFDRQRNANPFLHLFEALWMLGGKQDVETITQFVSRFRAFSDDGRTFHGAYGYRWRHWPIRKYNGEMGDPLDQLQCVARMLRKNPDDRRAVIGMWDPARDLEMDSLDIPCNDVIKVEVVDKELVIHVFNRSNDIVYGLYGANAVQFSMLQEYLAAMIGVGIGPYYHYSANFHAYELQPYLWDSYWPLAISDPNFFNPYSAVTSTFHVVPYPLVTHPKTFDHELQMFLYGITPRGTVFGEMDWGNPDHYANRFLTDIAMPMYRAFLKYKKDDNVNAAIQTLYVAHAMIDKDVDWLWAATEWLKDVAIKRRERRNG